MELRFNINSKSNDVRFQYLKEEASVLLLSKLKTASLMIDHQYLSLEVAEETQQLVGLSGYFNYELCPKVKIPALRFEKPQGLVCVTNEPLDPSMGYSYRIKGSAYYDNESKRLRIGKFQSNTVIVSISENFIVGLADSKIVGIHIENIE